MLILYRSIQQNIVSYENIVYVCYHGERIYIYCLEINRIEIGYASEIEKIKPRQYIIYSYIFFHLILQKCQIRRNKQVLDEIDYNSEQNVRANGAVSVVDGWRK